ncbi:MAG: class I SAM-dependent methyltransferase [Candidatus Eisenbacteria bacterium]
MHSEEPERVFPFGREWLRHFAMKGKEGGPGTPQAGNANAVKVRRVLQVTADLASRPMGDLRILDAGCGEGVYAIEAALRRARIVAIDARTERMSRGIECAEKHGLTNIEFRMEDVRSVSKESHQEFDVVFLLGILYHLDVPDVFHVLENVHELCREFVIIDTFISPLGDEEAEYGGRVYSGRKVREHEDGDSAEVRRGRVLRSLDNTFAFRFTRDSLVRVLSDVGFTSVYECLAPPEPLKPPDRITLVAHKGAGVRISTYPWINPLSEEQIEDYLRETGGE